MKMVSSLQVEPVSRTDQYKRVMKPLLERKRRARINRCLDELRDLLVAAMQAEGETVTRLEKADILELTVRHVRRLNQRRRLTIPSAGVGGLHDPRQDAVKFQQGFLAAAQQVQSFLLSTPTLVEPSASSRLLVHLSSCASAITGPSPSPSDIPPPHNPHPIPSPLTPSTATTTTPPSGGSPHHHPHMVSPNCSPSTSPPHLMDLSIKAPNNCSPQPPPPRLVAPTPIRKEPIIVLRNPCAGVAPAPAGPQDLSMKKKPPKGHPQQEAKDAWRPW